MKDEDCKLMAEMKAKGETEKAVISFFRVMGYKDDEIVNEMLKLKAVDEKGVTGQDRVADVVKLSPPEIKTHEFAAMAMLFLLLGLVIGFFVYPEVMPFLPIDEKTEWLVSASAVSCKPALALVRVYNLDYLPMPASSFSVVENNALCSPATRLDNPITGITLVCSGVFDDGGLYTLASNRTARDSFVCTYQ